MIRKINITIPKFIINYLPVHKRKPMRLQFLTVLLSVFETLHFEYIIWRNANVTATYVTGETMSMEWYLNLMCGSGAAITIETAGADGVSVGLQNVEPLVYINNGLIWFEPAAYYNVGLSGESSIYGTKTFIIKVPTAFMPQVGLINKIVNTYRAAGKSFKIVEI